MNTVFEYLCSFQHIHKPAGLSYLFMLLLFISCFTGCAQTNQAARPNILWIVWDTVRADHLSLYGYHTPFLTQWAAQARVFDDCISVASKSLKSGIK